ncbi:SID1 transmembrane family member 1-like [Bradysia coprophila]|uniref:SID1 transmembrane family member 1-like n=1 Tax=Bradysia coprophila TaxID=38358 RepID=UPI00187DCBD4|nr:SID1 transmembrane family member 1-like [Bradysia coprophila]
MKELISSDTVQKSLDRIYLLIGSIGIFYCIPTIQLLYTYHKISEFTGETDLCYRNYLCSHRLMGWDDFNHIYSNIVYVILAFAFCIFVIDYQQKQGLGNGVVHQFGIFYALGVSIGLEGIFSALYHVCPTALHFQYDTSFMLILSILTTIKIYQFRHPDPLCSHKYDTNLSPAESRAKNAPCIVKGFYDTHDLWHFLSAGAIFFFYMALLTLDDGILHKRREEIVGF